MIEAFVNTIAAKIGIAPHILKVGLVTACVGSCVWECYKNWLAPWIIAWQSREKGRESRLGAGSNAMKIPVSIGDEPR
jgi:hypothetical protein